MKEIPVCIGASPPNTEKIRKDYVSRTQSIVYVALFSVIIAICSWIAVPSAVPFTMQTFAVFCALSLLDGKKGTLAVLVYILLGIIGIPVFSNFRAGIGVLLGSTGGYIIGFLFAGIIYWLITSLFKKSTAATLIAMILGLLALYAVGTAWFIAVYTKNTGEIGVLTALTLCVFPFVIPDLIKIFLAVAVSKKMERFIKL